MSMPLAPPPPMPPRMCSCDTYEVSGASALAPLAMGRFDRVGKHPHHDSTSTARPFDVFRNAEAGTYLFFWAPKLDWHIGTQVCSYQALSCPGVIANASHDMNVGCPYATARRPWSTTRTGSQGQTEVVTLPDLTITCPAPPASPPAPSPPPISPESAGYLNGTARVAGILGGALGSLLFFSALLWFALCRPKHDSNPSRRGGGGGSEGEWEHEPSISIATGVPVPRERIATDPVIGVPAPGVELARMSPSSQAATVAEGHGLVVAGRAVPEVGVPVGVSGAIASGRAIVACQSSSVPARVG